MATKTPQKTKPAEPEILSEKEVAMQEAHEGARQELADAEAELDKRELADEKARIENPAYHVDMDEPEKAPEPVGHAKQPTRLTSMEHAVMTWHHVAEPGEPAEAFGVPASWAHVAKQLQVGHEIVVVAAEGTWRLHLYVRAVGRNEVLTGLIAFTKFGAAETLKDDTPYITSWRGPAKKWTVVSKESNLVVKDNFATQEMAAAWISNHLKALAA